MVLPYLTFGLLLIFLTKDLLAHPAISNNSNSNYSPDGTINQHVSLVEIMEKDPDLTYALAKYVVDQKSAQN